MRKLARITLIAAFSVVPGLLKADGPGRQFARDSYSLRYPATWTQAQQTSPDGSPMWALQSPDFSTTGASCLVAQNPLVGKRAKRLTKDERLDFFLTSSNKDLLFSVYPSLPTAQGINVMHTMPVTLGSGRTAVPAMQADFGFRVPNGHHFRVRLMYTFWPEGQLTVWCQTVARSASLADDEFHRRLRDFSGIFQSVAVSPM